MCSPATEDPAGSLTLASEALGGGAVLRATLDFNGS